MRSGALEARRRSVAPLEVALAAISLMLIIPLAIWLGRLWRNGAIAVMGAGALVSFAANWGLSLATTLTGGLESALFYNVTLNYVSVFVGIGGFLLLIAGWAIAIANASKARRVGWVVGLAAALFGTVLFFCYGAGGPDNGCFLGGDFPCQIINPTADMIWFAISSLLAPATLLAYALAPEPRVNHSVASDSRLSAEPNAPLEE
jgi:hypothetical protein